MRFAWITPWMRLLRVLAVLTAVCSLFAGRDARAEADTFGLGNGHSGALTYTGSPPINTYRAVTAINAPSGMARSSGGVRSSIEGGVPCEALSGEWDSEHAPSVMKRVMAAIVRSM